MRSKQLLRAPSLSFWIAQVCVVKIAFGPCHNARISEHPQVRCQPVAGPSLPGILTHIDVIQHRARHNSVGPRRVNRNGRLTGGIPLWLLALTVQLDVGRDILLGSKVSREKQEQNQ